SRSIPAVNFALGQEPYGQCASPKIAARDVKTRHKNKWRDEGKSNLHPFAFRLHPFSRSPYLCSRFEHHVELAKLFVLGQQIAAQARGKAALRTDRQLFEREIARRLIDSPAQLVDRFNSRDFGGDQ